MKRTLTAFITVITLITGNITYGMENVSKYEISYEQAYELMLENNNALKAAITGKEAARHEKNAALGHFSPKIAVNTTVAMLNHDIAMKVPGLGILPLQNKNLWEAGAGVVWNVFTGGKIIAANQVARAKYQISDHKLEQVKGELVSELTKRYYGVCLAEDVVKVRQELYDTTLKHLSDAKQYEKEGIIPKSERLHAEVAFAKAERELKASKRDLKVINESLIRLIKAENIELDGVLVSPNSRLFIYKKELPDIESIKTEVLLHNPLLKQSDGKQKIMTANYHAKMAEYSPTITLGAYDIFGADSLSNLVPRMAFAATANFTAFDGFTRLNNVKAAKAMKKQSEYEHADTRTNLLTYAERLYNELMKSKEQYDSTTKSIESAQEALRVTTLSFKEGYSTSLSVTDAQTALTAEKIDRLNALYKFDTALAELLKLEGHSSDIIPYIQNSETEQL